MVMVDSSVWIDYLNNTNNSQTDILDILFEKETIYIGDLILMEVLQGIRNDRNFDKTKAMFDLFPCVNLISQTSAIKSARNYRSLRKKGITIRRVIDIIIGTFCIENNFTLLHNDKDFLPIEKHLGLKSFRNKN
jgi:predicted nucleic acid-binding protein